MALKTSVVIGAVFTGAQAFTSSRKATELLSRSLTNLNNKKTTLNVNDKAFDRTQKKIELIGSALDKIGKRNIKIEGLKADQKEFQSNLMGKLAIGGAIVAPVKIAMDFEQSMANVGSVAKASESELQSLTAKARELGATTSWSASQTADGMKYLAMAGFNTNQTIAAMPGLLNLASAGATDLGSASDIASDILSGFGMKADEMGKLGDVLANTFTSSNTTLSTLGETMKYVAPVARSAGMSIEQVAAMTGKLGDEGVKGSMAGTALNAIIGRLASPSGEAAKKLKELGIKTKDDLGNLKELPSLLAEIEQATTGMGTGEKLEFMNAVYGMEAASKAQILQTQAASGALQEYEQALHEQGSAQRIAEKQNATAAGAMKRLGSAIESISITVGNVLLPSFTSFIEISASVIGFLGGAAESFPLVTKAVVGLTLGFGGVVIALSAGAYAASFFHVGLLRLQNIFTATSTAVKWLSLNLRLGTVAQKVYALGSAVLNTSLRATGTAFRFVGNSILWAGRALLTTPIGWAAMAIGAAAFTIYKYWQPLKTFFSGLWTGMVQGLSPVISAFKPLLSVFSGISDAVSGLIGWLGELFPSFKETTNELQNVASIGEAVGMVIGEVFSFAMTPVTALMESLGWVGRKLGLLASDEQPVVKYTQPEPKKVQAALRGQPAMKNDIHVVVNNPASTVEVEQAITNAMVRQFAGVPLTDTEY